MNNLKNFENCSLKKQKNNFSEKLMGLPKPPDDIFSITRTTRGRKTAKGHPTTSLIQVYMHLFNANLMQTRKIKASLKNSKKYWKRESSSIDMISHN